MRRTTLVFKSLRRLVCAKLGTRNAWARALPTLSSTRPPSKNSKAVNKIRAGPPKPEKNSLHQLHKIFNPGNPYATSSSLSDVVLVAIDIENTGSIKSGLAVERINGEIGIAILDTKKLKRASGAAPLQTYNFVIGTPKYAAKVPSRFIFGETIVIQGSNLVNRIQSLIPRDRAVVFVGHGVMNDLVVLQALHFHFPNGLVAVMDTLQVAREMRADWAVSLRDLLRVLGCPHDRLHCAGNDANFALRALLLLAATKFEKQGGNRRMVDILRQTGRQEIPYRKALEVKATVKRDQ